MDFTPFFFLYPSRGWIYILLIFHSWMNCIGLNVLISWWNFDYTKHSYLSHLDLFSWDVHWIFRIFQQLNFLLYPKHPSILGMLPCPPINAVLQQFWFCHITAILSWWCHDISISSICHLELLSQQDRLIDTISWIIFKSEFSGYISVT